MATLMQENLKNVDRKMKNKHRSLCRLAKNGN
jgi:predicted transcriptional regulator